MKLRNTAKGVVVAIGLAGCVGEGPINAGPSDGDGKAVPAQRAGDLVETTIQPAETRPALATHVQVDEAIAHSLARIEALQVVDVGGLVLKLPAQALSCYGICPGWEKAYEAERARQMKRLTVLAEVAEQVDKAGNFAPRDTSEAAAAVGALANLQIVQVVGLIKAKPKSNPSCYNLPCQVDVEAAKAIDRKHLGEIFAIVEAAKDNGL